MKISTQWLKDFVSIPPPVERIAERLTLAGLEVKNILPAPDQKDLIFEIEITTNRPDWLSHLGVAREIAACENLSLQQPSSKVNTKRDMPKGWKINLKEIDACPYYTGVLIEGIEWTETPDFMKERLHVCGTRSINLIVDITNYVLLEVGQPLHAFDADLLKAKEIQIRRARANEPMVMIDQSTLKLQPQDLVIADGEHAIALAGVMGGKDSEVSSRSRNLFLESAYFHPRWVRQSSKRFGIASESSYRFERSVDPEGVDLGRERALSLIEQYAKPRFISSVLKAGEKPKPTRARIHLNSRIVEKILGVKIKASEIASILTRLNLDVKPESTEGWSVGIPSFRSDLILPVDLVEEVARLHGYDQIPETLPERAPLSIQENPLLKLERWTRQFLCGAGLNETVTFSLISGAGLDPEQDLKKAVPINNPMNKDLVWMRPVMLPSLLSVIQKNFNFGAKNVPVFEMANIYDAQIQGKQEKVAAVALFGESGTNSWLDARRSWTLYDIKGLVEVLLENLGVAEFSLRPAKRSFLSRESCQNIQVGKTEIGILGKATSKLLKLWDLDSDVFFAEISLQKLLPHVRWIKPLNELPRYPAIDRDLSLLVQETVKAGEIQEKIFRLGEGLVRKVELFDLFHGGRVPAGFKNLAFRVTYQSPEKTLVSVDIQDLHTRIASHIASQYQGSFQK